MDEPDFQNEGVAEGGKVSQENVNPVYLLFYILWGSEVLQKGCLQKAKLSNQILTLQKLLESLLTWWLWT